MSKPRKHLGSDPSARSKRGLPPIDLRGGGGEIRIIGGLYKRTPLPVPAIDGLRPTPSRVRETLFNWLGHDLSGWHCVDAFAGTGALGFEAASRGAALVFMFEREGKLAKNLDVIKTKLQANAVEVRQVDALQGLSGMASGTIDLVFLDPPFHADLYVKALQICHRILNPNGFVYLESDKAWADEVLTPIGFMVFKSGKAGAVHYHLLQPMKDKTL